ncbi:MAG TPA: HNH endonuclease [Methylomirabilota bacterium]|jgi:5-methylcytosine-specific restriction endonuclease McrA|nr:HNH endonuclease [Methylomirabilota bacterium]
MDEVAVLVLNGSFEPLHFTNARRAITLLLAGKAETVEPSPRVVRSPSRAFPLPSVIRLVIYIRKPFVERVAFNKKNILRRDHYMCQYCGRRGDRLTVDHVTPRSKGGETTWTNVVAACLRCNLHKGNRTLGEAGMSLVHQPTHPQFLFSIHLLRHPHASLFFDAWRKYLTAVPAVIPSGV